MSRTPKIKELMNTRLLKEYGSWIYCENCKKTIGYLCYVTYDSFRFSYKCKCGGCGNVYISFADEHSVRESSDKLIPVKNRLCCPTDRSPLVTILSKNLDSFQCEVVCKACNTKYVEEQKE